MSVRTSEVLRSVPVSQEGRRAQDAQHWLRWIFSPNQQEGPGSQRTAGGGRRPGGKERAALGDGEGMNHGGVTPAEPRPCWQAGAGGTEAAQSSGKAPRKAPFVHPPHPAPRAAPRPAAPQSRLSPPAPPAGPTPRSPAGPPRAGGAAQPAGTAPSARPSPPWGRTAAPPGPPVRPMGTASPPPGRGAAGWGRCGSARSGERGLGPGSTLRHLLPPTTLTCRRSQSPEGLMGGYGEPYVRIPVSVPPLPHEGGCGFGGQGLPIEDKGISQHVLQDVSPAISTLWIPHQ